MPDHVYRIIQVADSSEKSELGGIRRAGNPIDRPSGVDRAAEKGGSQLD
jgi:hypothetical protein